MAARREQEPCRRCYDPICFSFEHTNMFGRTIPLDVKTNQPHKCRASDPTGCNTCGTLVYFDDRIRSRNEVLIPIEYQTEDLHECANKPKARTKRNYKIIPVEAL